MRRAETCVRKVRVAGTTDAKRLARTFAGPGRVPAKESTLVYIYIHAHAARRLLLGGTFGGGRVGYVHIKVCVCV